jgi:hypothetical protein
MHHCVGPLLFRGRSCAGARSRLQLAATALKKGQQVAGDLVGHFFGDGCFMERWLKFKREMDAVMAAWKHACKDMQKKSKKLEITFFT